MIQRGREGDPQAQHPVGREAGRPGRREADLPGHGERAVHQDADDRREADQFEFDRVATQQEVDAGDQQRHGRACPGEALRRADDDGEPGELIGSEVVEVEHGPAHFSACRPNR